MSYYEIHGHTYKFSKRDLPRADEIHRLCVFQGQPILGFGKRLDHTFRFLSNFWPVVVCDRDDPRIEYPSVEHAYQAAKTTKLVDRRRIAGADTPAMAKNWGRTLQMREGFLEQRTEIMEDLLRQKFSKSPLQGWLALTGEVSIIEENSWGDTFWGRVNGIGANHLGYLLEKIRHENNTRK